MFMQFEALIATRTSAFEVGESNSTRNSSDTYGKVI